MMSFKACSNCEVLNMGGPGWEGGPSKVGYLS